ncbi:hypothetical protein COCON_G00110010, partial [Conger conger]
VSVAEQTSVLSLAPSSTLSLPTVHLYFCPTDSFPGYRTSCMVYRLRDYLLPRYCALVFWLDFLCMNIACFLTTLSGYSQNKALTGLLHHFLNCAFWVQPPHASV